MNIAVPAFDLHAVPHGKKIYLYGASIWGRIAYTALKAAGIQASAFIDQHISQVKDLPVIRIDEVEAIEDAVFLICAARNILVTFIRNYSNGEQNIFTV